MGRLNTYRKLLLAVILCFPFIGISQIKLNQISINTDVFKKEHSQLIVNSDILFAGESLLYKTFNFSDTKKLSSLSKIMYISLRNEEDSLIFNNKILLKKGIGTGSLFIPANLQTGKYKLIGYTNFSLNNKESAISQKNIYIVNPFFKSHKNNLSESTKNNTVQLTYIEDSISNTVQETKSAILKTNKPTYQKREKINLSITNSNLDLTGGNYSLSVRKTNSISVLDPNPKIENIVVENDNTFYIPEVRGEIISGRITFSDTNLGVAEQQVALSIKGDKYIFKTAITNSSGHFFISIDEPYDTKNCIIQLLNSDSEKYNIILDNKIHHVENNNVPSNTYINSNLKDYLQERSIQIQIQNAYFDRTNYELPENVIHEPFYGERGYKYVLDEYIRFSTFKETCIEIVTTIKTKEENDNVIFEVFDPFSEYKESPFSKSSPLIIMDGIVILDPMEVYSFNTKNIESILVFPRPYRHGPSIFQGIIDIKTKSGDYKPMLSTDSSIEFELKSLTSMNSPFVPNYESNSMDRVPDYRVQLFWQSNVDLKSEEFKTEFYSSDIPGTYEAVIEGYNTNGKYFISKYNFKVE